MQYNRARSYDPAIGRWISRDPLGFEAGDSNLYRYVNNAPTLATDPSKLQAPVERATDHVKKSAGVKADQTEVVNLQQLIEAVGIARSK